jgi:RecA/RadA recombinase
MAIKKVKKEKQKSKKKEEVVEKKKRGRKPKEKEEKEVKVKGRKKKDVEEENSDDNLYDLHGEIDGILNVIEKEVGLSITSSASRVTTSTGLLTLDLALSGGLVSGGWYTFFGGEQSSKSTLAMTQLARAAVQKEIPILIYCDYEGSYDPNYMMAIAKSQGFKGDITDLFGIQDDETGEYIKKPIIRRYPVTVAEKFFDLVYKLEKNLPDKLYKSGKWWYVYEATKENKAKYGKYAKEKYLKRTGKLWLEAPNNAPQALVVVDSYPAMLPKNMDDDDAKAGIGAQARVFADQIKRIKGRMDEKKINILGINQLRLRPMVMMGNPEYEPGGEALKFYSDVRLRMAARAVPSGENRQEGSSQFGEEPSIEFEGGSDIYRYVHFRAHKNKLSVPNLEGWLRIWVRDGEQQARGYDPVYDSFCFLKSLKLVSGTKNRLKLDWKTIGVKNADDVKAMTWLQFKTLIIGNKKQIAKTLDKIGYDGKVFNLRSKLFALFEDKKAQKIYKEALKKNTSDADSDEEEED